MSQIYEQNKNSLLKVLVLATIIYLNENIFLNHETIHTILNFRKVLARITTCHQHQGKFTSTLD